MENVFSSENKWSDVAFLKVIFGMQKDVQAVRDVRTVENSMEFP